MSSYYIELRYLVPAIDPAAVEAHVEDMLDALDGFPELVDTDIGAELGRGRIDVCAHVDAADQAAAVRLVQTAVRQARTQVGTREAGDIDSSRDVLTVRPSELDLAV